MTQLIIFDFDGVIINSHQVQRKALKEAYFSVGGTGSPPYNEFFRHSGDSLKNIFKKMKLPVSMVKQYEEVSRENKHLIQLHAGMTEVLQSCKDTGYQCALCTGKSRERTMEILQMLSLLQFFDAVICSDDIANPKPHPESVFVILNTLSVKKENAIFVGDGINDVLCARNAGVRSVAVTWGDVPKNDLVKTKPDRLVDSAAELLACLIGKRSLLGSC